MTAERRRVLQMLYDRKIGVDDAEGLLDALEHVSEPPTKHKVEIISADPKVHRMMQQVEQIAQSDATVLIVGESGTGKELIARSIHQQSRRRDRPFVTINVPAVPEALLESELFGHEKGAFTGAVQLKKGLLESAGGGTVFLDEISGATSNVQAKLIQFLETGEFTRAGGTLPITADVRLITCAAKDLEQEVQAGKFRRDLYYRLKTVRLESPPLRERKDDIPLLVDHFLRKQAEQSGRSIPQITPEAIETLRAYDWPGNVRELRAVIERTFILCRGDTIQVEHLPELRMPNLDKPERKRI